MPASAVPAKRPETAGVLDTAYAITATIIPIAINPKSNFLGSDSKASTILAESGLSWVIVAVCRLHASSSSPVLAVKIA
ncbi:hypothetical protein E2C01_081423 [Portunus trituberculatus]|uniref:Uncharacterized protein n=1 Tax=Portunus trituberculatus TaxID=210409 RepID=A0A5B7IWM0_PORTR|nr:hypothetical protein [Portunus trituberculatus]